MGLVPTQHLGMVRGVPNTLVHCVYQDPPNYSTVTRATEMPFAAIRPPLPTFASVGTARFYLTPRIN